MDEELISKAQTGDISAYETLIRKYQETAYNFAYRLTRNLDDANDLTQEVFVKIFQSLPKFQKQCSFSTWMYRIVHNTFLDQKKRTYYKNRAVEVSFEEKISTDNLNEPSINPVEEFERQHLSRSVQEALGKLPPKHQMIITLYHIQGMSYQEISGIIGISAGTVMSRLSRARRKLRNIILKMGIFKTDKSSNLA